MRAKYWLLLSFLVLYASAATAQRADGVYHIACMVQMKDAGEGKQTAECTTHPRLSEIGLGGKVGFDVTTTQELMDEQGAPEVTDLILFIDGQALPGTHPIVESQTDEALPPGSSNAEEKNQDKDYVVTFRVTFSITRDLSTDKGKDSWNKILGGMGKQRKEVALSVGLINGPPLPSAYKAEFVRLGGGHLTLFLLAAIAIGIGFIAIAGWTGALRDKEPAAANTNVAQDPTQRAYSLSRTQIAIWTLLVIYAYLFIWLITGEYNTEIPNSILLILGISGGTFATAAAIDKSNPGTTVATTNGFFADMLSNQGGAGLHRVQFGVWSVVLMIVFCVTTYETLAMPNFNAGLLGLMGISSAAYAGMKIPETK